MSLWSPPHEPGRKRWVIWTAQYSGSQVSEHRGRGPKAVAVAVTVSVSAPVMVAALVNGNDVVSVIDAVADQGSINFVNMATMRSSNSTPRA
jgi:hypothetical protein